MTFFFDGKSKGWVFALALCLSVCLAARSYAVADGSGQPEKSGLTVIYGANLPEIGNTGGGLPALGGLVERTRAAGPAIFLFGGDSLGPSMLGALDKGGHIIDILNQMEPDAMGVSKREFFFQEDELILRAAEAFFPLICSNVEDPLTGGNLGGLEKGILLRSRDMALGVVALVDENLLPAYPPDRVHLKKSAAREEAQRLRAKGADVIVLMMDCMFPESAMWLADGVVDVIINNNGEKSERLPTDHGISVRLDSSGETALELKLPSGEVRFLSLNDEAPSEAVFSRVEYYLARIDKLLNVEVGVTATSFDTLRASVRSQENAFGNLVADAVRDSIGADVALINGGVIRGDRMYEAGIKLTRRDIRAELPFHNEVARLRVNGADLHAALENGLSRVQERNGRFPHVSGMTVTYDSSLPPGKRVLSVTVGTKPLRDDDFYTLATTSYISFGGDDYDMLSGKGPSLASVLLSDVVRQRVEESGKLAPVIDGRLRDVQSAGGNTHVNPR